MTRTLSLLHSVPLEQGEDGAVRVTGSRVTLDTLVGEFLDGATPEQIRDSFPSVALGAVYGAIAYYLEHRDQIDAYLTERREESDEVRRRVEHRQGAALRDRLRARRGQLARS